MLRRVGVGREELVPVAPGVSLWVARQGEGVPLVLCHGGPGMWDYLGPVADAVDDIADVVRYDQRGCGRSNGDPPYTVDDHVGDLDAVRRRTGFDSWVVGGHSWGATLALTYARSHPDHTRGLVYVSGTGLGREWNAAYHAEVDRRRGEHGVARLAELDARTRTAEEEREYRVLAWAPDHADKTRAFALAASLDAPYALNRRSNRDLVGETKTWDEADLVAACARLHVPALVVHGTEDPRPAWGVDSLVEALPDVQLVLLDGCGHVPWVEAHGRFTDALRAFLLRIDA
jgi:proline iminopeptidase